MELKRRADIVAWNELCAEMGSTDKMQDLDILDYESRAMRDIELFSILKAGVTWAQLGLTLPTGTLPVRNVLMWNILETLYSGDHK